MGGELFGDAQLTGWAGKLGSRAVTIRSHLPNVEARSGAISQCPDCDGETWHLWQIDGHEHPHLQCAGCGQVYCWAHDCAKEAAGEQALKREDGGQ